MRTRGWSAFTVTLASMTALAGAVAIGPPSAQAAASCPTGPPAGGSSLAAVAVTSATNGWATGVHYDGSANQTLIEHWNGKTWQAVPSPNPGGTANPAQFSGVAATSSSDAWAVGEYCHAPMYQTLAEHWNGSRWKPAASDHPGRSSHLIGVAATSTADAWAVGSYETNNSGTGTQDTLIEHWNGAAWEQVPSPSPDASPKGGPVLLAVAATSLTNAWAVGSYYDPRGGQTLTLIEHWNGTRWLRVPSPSPGPDGLASLSAVAATTLNNAWAVGEFYDGVAYQTLIVHWDGRAWSQVPSPDPAGTSRGNVLLGVTATSPSNAWAAGDYVNQVDGGVTLVLHWNGATWTAVPSPAVGSSFPGDFAEGIAGSPAASPWLVGSDCPTTACPVRQTLAEHWTGTSWVRVPS